MSPIPRYVVKEIGPRDIAGFVAVYADVNGDRSRPAEGADGFVEQLATGAHLWVIGPETMEPAGYAIIDPIPGLPGVYDFRGGVVPTARRRGLGAALLSHVQTTAGAAGVRRLSVRVDALADEAAVFLLRRGFVVEHEEVLLQRESRAALPPIPAEPSGDLVTYPRPRAIREFCRLYLESFQDRPWSQPYSEAEVEETLVDAEDLLFMEVAGRPIGVAWQQTPFNEPGEVEPLGIIPEYHGRGYGRRLLLAALHHLRRGAATLQIGAWRQNTIALNLYKSVGFSEVQNWYYLSCDLQGLKGE